MCADACAKKKNDADRQNSSSVGPYIFMRPSNPEVEMIQTCHGVLSHVNTI